MPQDPEKIYMVPASLVTPTKIRIVAEVPNAVLVIVHDETAVANTRRYRDHCALRESALRLHGTEKRGHNPADDPSPAGMRETNRAFAGQLDVQPTGEMGKDYVAISGSAG